MSGDQSTLETAYPCTLPRIKIHHRLIRYETSLSLPHAQRKCIHVVQVTGRRQEHRAPLLHVTMLICMMERISMWRQTWQLLSYDFPPSDTITMLMLLTRPTKSLHEETALVETMPMEPVEDDQQPWMASPTSSSSSSSSFGQLTSSSNSPASYVIASPPRSFLWASLP